MTLRSSRCLVLTATLTANLVTASLAAVFSDGFENGLDPAKWRYQGIHNWQGTKQITTDNPHSGAQALYMSGADWEPGGCSFMAPIFATPLAQARIDFWFRTLVLRPVDGDGPGSDAWMGIYLNDAPNLWAGTVYQQSELPNENVSYLPPDASRVFGTVNLTSLSGWHQLSILYRSGTQSSIEILLDNASVGLAVSVATSLAPLTTLTIGVGGQYHNLGSWVIDDFQISDLSTPASVPDPTATSPLLALALATLVAARRPLSTHRR